MKNFTRKLALAAALAASAAMVSVVDLASGLAALGVGARRRREAKR